MKMSKQFKVGLTLIIVAIILFVIIVFVSKNHKDKETIEAEVIDYVVEKKNNETIEDLSSEGIELEDVNVTEAISEEGSEWLPTGDSIEDNPYEAVEALLANRELAESYLSQNNVEDVDLDNPYSYNSNAVVYDAVVNGENVYAQFSIMNDMIIDFMIMGYEEENPEWLPVGDSNWGYNLEITDVQNNKFDMSYEDHAALFESIINVFGYQDENDNTLQVSMLDGENGLVIIEVFNNGKRITIEDTGDLFKVWDDSSVRYFNRSKPFSEIAQ